MWSQLWAYTLRMKTSQGQNKLLPCSNNTPQQMDHLLWKQNTFPRSSFLLRLLSLISPTLLPPHPHALSHFLWFSLHQAFLSGSFPPFPSFLPSPRCSICLGSSQEGHQKMLIYSRCLPLQKCVSEELAFKATMQDESNIVGRFVTSPPEHQLALI